jgi:hypothetical protein
MGQVKFHLGVGPGAPMRNMTGMATYFTHKNFSKRDEPETLAADLEGMTTVRVNLWASATDKPPFQPLQSCSSDLLKTEIQYFTISLKDLGLGKH